MKLVLKKLHTKEGRLMNIFETNLSVFMDVSDFPEDEVMLEHSNKTK